MVESSDAVVQRRIIERLYQLAPHEGYTQSLLNELSIVIICQGRKRWRLVLVCK